MLPATCCRARGEVCGRRMLPAQVPWQQIKPVPCRACCVSSQHACPGPGATRLQVALGVLGLVLLGPVAPTLHVVPARERDVKLELGPYFFNPSIVR